MNSMDPVIASKEQIVTSIPPAMHHDPESARQDIAAWDALHREEKQLLQEGHSTLYTAGRLLLAALFLAMAYAKLVHFKGTAEAVATAGYWDASLLVGIALALELVGGVLLALGWRVRLTAGALIGYLVLVTAALNWDQSLAINRALALANLGFIGGLLLLAAHGAGASSLDKLLSKHHGRPAKA